MNDLEKSLSDLDSLYQNLSEQFSKMRAKLEEAESQLALEKQRLDLLQSDPINIENTIEDHDQVYQVFLFGIKSIENCGPRSLRYNEFFSEEYAKMFKEKCRQLAQLLRCKWHYDVAVPADWGNTGTTKYAVVYNHHTHLWEVDVRHAFESTEVIFVSEKAAEEAAKTMNSNYFKWRRLGIDE